VVPDRVAWQPGESALSWRAADSQEGGVDPKRRLGAEVRTPRPRLGRRKFAASLGPSPACRHSRARQGARRPRQRRCLLKGCEKPFHPTHPQARYCSPECRAAARRWRRRCASRHYRQTSNGRQKRQAQSQRYRCRCAERRQAARAQEALPPAPESSGTSPAQAGEGQRPASESEFFCCQRPGCEDHFLRTRRSPCQKFCSPSCRQALRRVIERERRWRQRARLARRRRSASPCRGP
jgi:hypothetical protein